MKDEDLKAKLLQVSLLKGDFLLRSGQRSSHYFDKYQFEARPALLSALAKKLELLLPEGVEVLAGLEMGGIPLATALSLRTGLPLSFVRKKAKSYGTCKLAEGENLQGKRVCVLEDVITTGGQVVKSVQDLRQLGAKVQDVLCVLLRGGSIAKENLSTCALNLHFLFEMKGNLFQESQKGP